MLKLLHQLIVLLRDLVFLSNDLLDLVQIQLRPGLFLFKLLGQLLHVATLLLHLIILRAFLLLVLPKLFIEELVILGQFLLENLQLSVLLGEPIDFLLEISVRVQQLLILLNQVVVEDQGVQGFHRGSKHGEL